eukprot:1141605-Pelagomonas_calceolata.AAC.2
MQKHQLTRLKKSSARYWSRIPALRMLRRLERSFELFNPCVVVFPASAEEADAPIRVIQVMLYSGAEEAGALVPQARHQALHGAGLQPPSITPAWAWGIGSTIEKRKEGCADIVMLYGSRRVISLAILLLGSCLST